MSAPMMEAPCTGSGLKQDDVKEDHDKSPGLTKKLGRLSINSALSPAGKASTSPHGSPVSPSVSRRTSSSMLRIRPEERSSPRRVVSATHAPSPAFTPPSSEEKPSMTAVTIAKKYFLKELAYHLGSHLSDTNTLVITHDSCYGHRYSRSKTSKTILSLIVERPERIQAGMLGLATAYVRLGQRHAGGAHPPHPQHEPTANVPFHIRKTARTVPITSPIVAAVHGAKWMQELKAMCDTAGEKLATDGRELARPETPTHTGSTSKPPFHEGDLYLCKESLDAFEGALGGVCEAVDTVFDDAGDTKNYKRAFVCIRPPGHHCSADWPSGFCWINNVHVGIEHAIQNHGLTHAAIIDFDLHHGDGSQAIAWERNARSVKAQKSMAKNAAFKRSSVGYFSIHDINSYPCEDGDLNKVQRASVCIENGHGQNVWNIHLQPWSTEAEFWELYDKKYMILLDKARAYLGATTQRLRSTAPNIRPRAAIFLSAGFDASQWETPSMQRHKVNVPTEFYARITSDVVKMAQDEGLGTEGRVISVLEGGYSDRAIASGVFSHLSGLTAAADRMGETATSLSSLAQTQRSWNPDWWSDAALQELEAMMKPPAPLPPPVKKWSGPKEVPTYQTPTQSFTAKVVDPTKLQRHTAINIPTPPKSRPQTPPPPEVHWATAAYQLSRLLIPSEDRQVHSCRHEDLNEPKKRERHSSIGIQSIPSEPVGERRQTRGRRAKEDIQNALGSDDRRKTISNLPVRHEQSDTASDAGQGTSTVTTSKTSRPPSRAGVKIRQPTTGPAQGVNVTRTRRASLNKDGQRKSSSNAPPIPQLPANNSTSDTVGESADVDALTTGMKKITLRLPNPSAKPAAAPAAPKKTTRKPPAARVAKAPAAKTTISSPAPPVNSKQLDPMIVDSPLDAQEQLGTSHVEDKEAGEMLVVSRAEREWEGAAKEKVSSSNMASSATPVTMSDSGFDHALQSESRNGTKGSSPPAIPDSQEEHVLNEMGPETISRPKNDIDLDIVPYQPPGAQVGGQTAALNSHQEPIQWLPPNIGTNKEVATSGKDSLPSFSATGHIPFLPTFNHDSLATTDDSDALQEVTDATHGPAMDTKPENRLDESVWDVPVTPQRP